MKNPFCAAKLFQTARLALLILSLAIAIPQGRAQLVINEFDADTAGVDALEFIELYDGGVGNTPLDGKVLVFYNGTTSATARGAYEVFDLDGLSTDAGGYFLAANPGVEGIAERVTAGTGLVFDADSLQNGEDGVAIYSGLNPADFDLASQPRTLPSDLALGAGVVLLDAVVYETGSDSGFGLLAEFAGLIGDVLDENANGNKDTASWARDPDGVNPLDLSLTGWVLADPPTPGAPNVPSFELDLAFSPASISESAGAGAVEVTVSRDGDAAAPLLVTFGGNDATELVFPESVTIPAGASEFVFQIDVLDDGAADGTQTVTITASAPDFFPGTASLMVEDDGDAPTLVINEIYGQVVARQDPNQDGATNFTGDEFVELVNISGGLLDISGWSLADLEGVRHVFPPGTVLGTDCALVVFGGGGFTEGVRAEFGNAFVQKATSGLLGLNDSGDTIIVAQQGIERAGASYVFYDGASGGDLTRSPELTGQFTNHVLVGAGPPFSPGLRGDTGLPFCDIIESLTVSGSPSFAEDAGAGVAAYTVSRSGSTASALIGQLASSDPSEAQFQTNTFEIPAGSTSVLVLVDAIDDPYVDGDQTLDLAAHAAGYVSGLLEIIVTDSATDSEHILINELDIDSNSGSDVAEFIELYDGGFGDTPLDGYVVVLYNGVNGQVYDAYDLDGKRTNAGGFFVIGAPGVPNVGLTDLPGTSGFLQNGPGDAVALYVGNEATYFVGSGLSGSAVDAVVYGGTGVDGDTLGPALGLGIARVPTDGVNDTVSRLPDGGNRLDLSGFGDGLPTPGASNVAVGGPSAYANWAAGFPGLGAQLDDDDCDGLSNLMEYALGTNPLAPNRSGSPTGALVAGQLQLTITKGTEASADPTLAYTVEASTDLHAWTTSDTVVLIDTATTLTVGYSGAAPRISLRLRVQLTN